ncbi:uncharacterized protein [Macrobrachium rosenbergii]|uniref:uncharacterized protein n=1 Tax=Macrobrachium rosenbergii TaxID=79674 RepID=UPI0034D73F00
MILPTVQLRVTRLHKSKICNLALASYILGGYDLLLGQDFQSLGMSNSQEPPFIPVPVPPEYSVQWPPPSKQISMPSPVPGPAPVPVSRHPIDLPPGDPKINSPSLPVPLECTEHCQAPSLPNGEQSPDPIPVPDPALVSLPEHVPDLHSRGPSSDLLSSPGLALLPMPVREMDSSDHSGSSPKGAALQPLPELVIATRGPPTPTRISSSLSQPTDASVSKDSATPQLAD